MAFLFPRYFPFCIPLEKETSNIPVGSGTAYPIGMSLADVMSLYWRSITFSHILTYSASVLADLPTSTSVNVSCFDIGQLSLASPLWPTKMSGMICASIPDGYLSNYAGQAGSNGVMTSSDDSLVKTGGQTDVTFFNPFGGIIVRGNLFYPEIRVSSILTFSGNNSYGTVLKSVLEPVQTKLISDALKLNINGTEYKADLFIRIFINEFSYAPDSASASFVISGLNDRETS